MRKAKTSRLIELEYWQCLFANGLTYAGRILIAWALIVYIAVWTCPSLLKWLIILEVLGAFQ